MLSEEEKKAIKDLEKTIEFYNKKSEKIISVTVDNFDVDILNTVLNLITKLQKENEKKDKIIDEMAKYIIDLIKYNNPEEERDKEEIKKYFIKKVEKEGVKDE